MDPRLFLQLSAKNNQRLFEQDAGGLSQIIYLTPQLYKTCCTSFPISLNKNTPSDIRKEINQEQMKFS